MNLILYFFKAFLISLDLYPVTTVILLILFCLKFSMIYSIKYLFFFFIIDFGLLKFLSL